MSDNQEIQQELLEDARELPGVAEAVEVYGKLQPYVPQTSLPATLVQSYATGGNTQA